ncbi:hypothetical protein GLOIN_2v1806924 [Rhizophagus clarus]|uniref:Uncharacterized protein n=1 Tax=Rhizophagus clarus TaxID=94130 RepID=A0A8H3LTZ7_9GLOM|nr:hypothetical protein GLOIN_2v1806924 [Rhizophagus clarus]
MFEENSCICYSIIEDVQTEIDSLRQRITELEAEKAELKAELEVKNSEIPELKKKLAESCEIGTEAVDNTPNNNLSNFNLVTDHHEKSLEDKETDEFLNEVHKKRNGDDIRRHNKEKKLQR